MADQSWNPGEERVERFESRAIEGMGVSIVSSEEEVGLFESEGAITVRLIVEPLMPVEELEEEEEVSTTAE